MDDESSAVSDPLKSWDGAKGNVMTDDELKGGESGPPDMSPDEGNKPVYTSGGGEPGLWDWKPLSDELFCDERCARILGYAIEEMSPSRPDTWLKLVHPGDGENLRGDLDRCLGSGGRAFVRYLRARHRDGRWIYAVCGGRLMESDEQGRPFRVSGFFYDLTEKRTYETALRESESKYRALVENSLDGIMRFDRGHRHLYVNPQAERETGIPVADFLGKPHRELGFPDELCDLLEKSLEQVFISGHVNRVEFDLPNGNTLDWMIIPEPDDRGVVNTVITASRNITDYKRVESERARLESQLYHAQKMEAVGRLAGSVAHDFNNMLSVILGHSDLALMEMSPEHPLYESMTSIGTAARRSAELTRQLMVFARKQPIAPRLLSINEAIGSITGMLQHLVGRETELAWIPAANLNPVKMDPAQLDQILTSLCSNSRDAMTGAGRITIETGNVHFDRAYCDTHGGFREGSFVMIAVSDNGRGMDARTLNSIYEPFFTTKDHGKGTGLSTVYGIVKQNSGFINVYSEPGVGTTFRVYFPSAESTEPEQAGRKNERPLLRGAETVLVVEDEPAILTLTERMLKDLGYQVILSSRPTEALRLAEENSGRIQLLLTDIVMPEMNGMELAEKLTALYPSLKTLFMSGYTANVLGPMGVMKDSSHFIQKPFSVSELSVRVRAALDGGA
jgi:PAS domain S-box-containing protein